MSPADTPTDARPVLTARGLRKSFGGVEVLRGIDLEVHRGEVVALIGPSGSGKTTVLRSLNSLEVPDGGVVELADGSVLDFDRGVGRKALTGLRDHSAMVFQHFNLFPHLRVIDNVTLAARKVHRASKSEAYARGTELLEQLGLGAKAREFPDRLSGGQQQRVAIVRAVMTDPELLLLDEITSALDPQLVGEVLDLVRVLRDRGSTMLMATHEMSFAREVADRIVFMKGGRIVEQGTPAQILDSPQHPDTIAFLERERRGGAL